MRTRGAILLVFLAGMARAESSVDVTDSFIMGAGRWPCAQVMEVAQGPASTSKGDLAGWILGVWSHATTAREKGFTDIVETVGGQGIFEATLAECAKAPPSTMLYRVVYSMIENTNPQN